MPPRALVVTILLALPCLPAGAQQQRWLVDYERMVGVQVHMHGPNQPVARQEHARLVLTPKGDSVTGQLVALASPGEPEHVIGDVRGIRKQNDLSLRVTKPFKPMGYIATQWDAVMAWLRETMHGVAPTVVTMRLFVTADDIRGTVSTVTVDGAPVDGPRPLTGKREP